METRQQYLILFLRGCALAADKKELGVEQGQLLVNGELMREAADEFEKLIPEEEPSRTDPEELTFNLARAEIHARKALDLLYKRGKAGDLMRSLWYRIALGRAQSILMSLYKQELGRR
jgi:hypothetical protein